MPDRPVMMFPQPEPVPRPKKPYGFPKVPLPNLKGQAERIEQQFEAVRDAFVSDEPGDVERVLVMETSSAIGELQKAVDGIRGLEWLAEMDVDHIELHNLYNEETEKAIKGGRFYLLSSNKQATDRLLGLWKKYKKGEKLGHGFGVFKTMFQYLLTLRRWDVRDRLRDTNILEKWKEDYQVKKGTKSEVDCEIELHYRKDGSARGKALQGITHMVEAAGGSVGQFVCIEEVAFHALKVTLPVGSISSVIEHDWDSPAPAENLLPLFRSEAVRYFRPVGQQIDTAEEPSEYPTDKTIAPAEDKPPVLALLDGVPLLQHHLLADRIIFYDPDRYSDTDDPSQQKHGTAMASLMCHDDWSRPQAETRSLTRRIYARPVMKWHPPSDKEQIPSDCFQEDIIERAVREMFEGPTPTGPKIKVINLSLGNNDQQYLHEMSPWARVLDWLSFKYGVLFIVSAGNYFDPIHLDQEIDSLSPPGDMRRRVVLGIDKDQRNHRLLSPSESMNALTVGALQSDFSGELGDSVNGFDPVDDMNMPAPYSRIGPGYRGTIKPEVFVCGGRLLYETPSVSASALSPVITHQRPGVKVACPSARTERLKLPAYAYGAGTSHAAAIASHGAGHVFEMLEEIRENALPSAFDAVLIKALLVHSASQGENVDVYDDFLKESGRPITKRIKQYRSRYLGYGNMNVEKVLKCTRTRATAIGWGRIQKGERHRFNFPLPEGSSIQDYLRLTVTLAWFSPINPLHIGKRRAKLFFEGDGLSAGGHHRQESDWQQVRKGTVQHEIFQMNKTSLPGDNLALFVECAAAAGTLDVDIPYGLAVTLEIAERENIDLYQMVKNRIRQPVGVTGASN